MRRLSLRQGALLLDRDRLRLGEDSFEALDLAAQLLQLHGVGLDRERRFRALLGLVGDFLELGLRGLLDLLRSDFQRLCVGLDRLSLRNLRYLLDFLDLHNFLARHDLIGLSRDLVDLWLSRNGGELCLLLDGCRLGCFVRRYVVGRLGARSGWGDGRRASRSLGRPARVSSVSASSSTGGAPSAKPYSVLRAPPLCIASACATAAPDAKPSSTMIWPSGRFDCCWTSRTVASCSSLMSPSSVISSPS